MLLDITHTHSTLVHVHTCIRLNIYFTHLMCTHINIYNVVLARYVSPFHGVMNLHLHELNYCGPQFGSTWHLYDAPDGCTQGNFLKPSF